MGLDILRGFSKRRSEERQLILITYCVGNDKVVSQQAVVQQGRNDAFNSSGAPV